MIRAIGAVDDRLGLGTDDGIPWKVPADVEHFRATVASSDVLMGYATYVEFEQPLPGGTNFVATRRGSTLRDGFVPVADLDSFLAERVGAELWIIGGAKVYARDTSGGRGAPLTRVGGTSAAPSSSRPSSRPFGWSVTSPSPPVADTPTIRFQPWRRTPGPGGGTTGPDLAVRE